MMSRVAVDALQDAIAHAAERDDIDAESPYPCRGR